LVEVVGKRLGYVRTLDYPTGIGYGVDIRLDCSWPLLEKCGVYLTAAEDEF
jgi:hypothetical protein